MKRLIALFVLMAVCVPAVRADSAAPLTTLRAVADLTNAQASAHMPATFEATVVYFRNYQKELFVQDGDTAIFVHATTSLNLTPGDRVRVRGQVHESFRPYVDSDDITWLGHGAPPQALSATYEQMIRGEIDCRRVTVRARVLSADIVPNSELRMPGMFLQMLVDGGQVDANVNSTDQDALESLLDADVEITGAVSGHFDNKMQQTGVLFHVQSLDDVKILRHAAVNPWSLPLTSMDRLITGYSWKNLGQRIRIHGTITYYEPETALVIQNGAKSMWVTTQTSAPLRVGETGDAIGFPDVQDGFLVLTASEFRLSSAVAPVTPSPSTWPELAAGGNNAHSRAFDLVSIEGLLVAQVRQAAQDEYVLNENGHLFAAAVRHNASLSPEALPPMRQIPVGARVRVTGICVLESADPFKGDVPFHILMRSYDDIAVVARPSPVNVRHLIALVALLLLVIFGLGAWSWRVERKRRRESISVAYLERRRNLILKEINGACSLSRILEHVTDLVTYKLQGAVCWYEIEDGSCFGQRPAKITSQRIIRQEIRSRSGALLGTLSIAIPSFVEIGPEESAAMALGTGLAKLAIETSHLYRDLVRRSEFDLLTEVPNRFALEKQLETLLEEASASGSMVGFIFIDLDRFKEINDHYGHRTGDVYLQEVAQRMKRQLRPGDVLARLGGDEFGAVVPGVHSRAEVEEIALRLEHCFDEPFVAEGHPFQGAASLGIALYPQDATSRDSLLSSADTAMYAAKNRRRGPAQMPAGRSEKVSSPRSWR
jgi:diguanylate cyclase (GGDEF)-like protein